MVRRSDKLFGRTRSNAAADDSFQSDEAVRKGGRSGLKDQRRFDLVKSAAAHGGDRLESRSGDDLVLLEFLAAPRADDDVGRPTDDRVAGDDPVPGRLARGEFGNDVRTSRGIDEFRHPGYPRNHRVVPFLEIDFGTVARPRRALARVFDIGGELIRRGRSAILRADQRPEGADHVKDFRDGPLGDPVRPLLWVSKSLDKLSASLTGMGHSISPNNVRKLLCELGFSLTCSPFFTRRQVESVPQSRQGPKNRCSYS